MIDVLIQVVVVVVVSAVIQFAQSLLWLQATWLVKGQMRSCLYNSTKGITINVSSVSESRLRASVHAPFFYCPPTPTYHPIKSLQYVPP